MLAQKGGVKFSDKEAEYLLESRLGRIATVSKKGQPHAVPVVYQFDGTYIYFGGWNISSSLKFRNIRENRMVAFVVDDVVSTKPWRPRGIEVRGVAEILEENGEPYVRITPLAKASWGGIEG